LLTLSGPWCVPMLRRRRTPIDRNPRATSLPTEPAFTILYLLGREFRLSSCERSNGPGG
jgi:hypothetical protein